MKKNLESMVVVNNSSILLNFKSQHFLSLGKHPPKIEAIFYFENSKENKQNTLIAAY